MLKEVLVCHIDGTQTVEQREINVDESMPNLTPEQTVIADLAETVSDLMVEVDKIKLGVTDK